MGKYIDVDRLIDGIKKYYQENGWELGEERICFLDLEAVLGILSESYDASLGGEFNAVHARVELLDAALSASEEQRKELASQNEKLKNQNEDLRNALAECMIFIANKNLLK